MPGCRRTLQHRFLAAVAALWSCAAMMASVHAADVPQPVLDQGKGEHCVEDTEYMRKNHMTLLMHQRDQTVLLGVRTKHYSLKNCIACHASKTGGGVIGQGGNFCQSCHSYVGVKLDCFECHASRPSASVSQDSAARQGGVPAASPSLAASQSEPLHTSANATGTRP